MPGRRELLLRTGGVSSFFVSYSKKKEKGHSLIRPILRKRETSVIVCFDLLDGRGCGLVLGRRDVLLATVV